MQSLLYKINSVMKTIKKGEANGLAHFLSISFGSSYFSSFLSSSCAFTSSAHCLNWASHLAQKSS